MRLYVTDQADEFSKLLAELITKPTMRFDKGKLTEKVSTIHIATDRNLKETNLDFLFDYKIFSFEHNDLPNSMGTREKKNENRRYHSSTGDYTADKIVISEDHFWSKNK